jgi:hypothetical protein
MSFGFGNDHGGEPELFLTGRLRVRVVSELDLHPISGVRCRVAIGGSPDCGPG